MNTIKCIMRFCYFFSVLILLSGCGGGSGSSDRETTPIPANDLSDLTTSDGTISPVFSHSKYTYIVAVDYSVSSIIIRPKVSDNKSVITVNGIVVSSGDSSGAIALSVGYTNVEVTVTPASGSPNTYTLIIRRNDLLTTAGGISIKLIPVPSVPSTITGSAQFPNDISDSDFIDTPSAFQMAETDTTYELWKEVYDWAVHSTRGVSVYTFTKVGQNGADKTNSFNGYSSSVSVQFPVSDITWNDAVAWCNALTEYYNANNGTDVDLECVYYTDSAYTNIMRSSSGTAYCKPGTNGFRLPTMVEYSFAARYIGPAMPDHSNFAYKDGIYYYKGKSASGATADYTDSNATFNVAVFSTRRDGSSTGVTGTKTVKSKHANSLGLYDMSGNIHKWCFDISSMISSCRSIRGGFFDNSSFSGEKLAIYGVAMAYFWSPISSSCSIGFRFVKGY